MSIIDPSEEAVIREAEIIDEALEEVDEKEEFDDEE